MSVCLVIRVMITGWVPGVKNGHIVIAALLFCAKWRLTETPETQAGHGFQAYFQNSLSLQQVFRHRSRAPLTWHGTNTGQIGLFNFDFAQRGERN